jgi:hypothetical protein
VAPSPMSEFARLTDDERIALVHTLKLGTEKRFIESNFGPPQTSFDLDPKRTAVFYEVHNLRLLLLYDEKEQLTLLAAHPLTAKIRQKVRMPKPHTAVELDFNIAKFSQLGEAPQLRAKNADAFEFYTFQVVTVSTGRDFRYAEYRYCTGPHFEVFTLGISLKTVRPDLKAEELYAIRGEFRPDIIAYFSYEALYEGIIYESDSPESKRARSDRLDKFLSLANDAFQLIEYPPT